MAAKIIKKTITSKTDKSAYQFSFCGKSIDDIIKHSSTFIEKSFEEALEIDTCKIDKLYKDGFKLVDTDFDIDVEMYCGFRDDWYTQFNFSVKSTFERLETKEEKKYRLLANKKARENRKVKKGKEIAELEERLSKLKGK